MGGKIPSVGVKIPREILPPGGQAARGYLHPRGASCPGGKINRYTGTKQTPCDNDLRNGSMEQTSVSCRISTIHHNVQFGSILGTYGYLWHLWQTSLSVHLRFVLSRLHNDIWFENVINLNVGVIFNLSYVLPHTHVCVTRKCHRMSTWQCIIPWLIRCYKM